MRGVMRGLLPSSASSATCKLLCIPPTPAYPTNPRVLGRLGAHEVGVVGGRGGSEGGPFRERQESASLHPMSLRSTVNPTECTMQNIIHSVNSLCNECVRLRLSSETRCEASGVWLCAGHCDRTRRLLLWGCLRATPSKAPETRTLRYCPAPLTTPLRHALP